MTNQVKQAFSPEVIKLQVEQILPLRKIEPSVKKTKKYRQIAASIAEVGVIEHMVVHAQPNMPDKFMLLDGHLRLEVLKDMGTKEVCCLVSKDDEAFTYNHKVNRLSPIQEHFMILKAIEKGVAMTASPRRSTSTWARSGRNETCSNTSILRWWSC